MRLKQRWHSEVLLLPPFVRDQPTFGGVVLIIYFRVAKVDFWVTGSMRCAQSGKSILVGPYMNKVGVTVSHTHLWLLNSILFLSEHSY